MSLMIMSVAVVMMKLSLGDYFNDVYNLDNRDPISHGEVATVGVLLRSVNLDIWVNILNVQRGYLCENDRLLLC